MGPVVAHLATVLLASLPARAGSVFWATDNSGNWLDPGNWSSNPALPGTADDVTIDRLPANPTVTLSATNQQATIHSLTLGNSLDIQEATLAIASTLTLDNTLTLEGGTIRGATINAGTGGRVIVSPASPNFFDAKLDSVTLNAPLTLNTFSTLDLIGTWRNNNAITVLGDGQLWLKGNVTTDAIGTINAPAEGVILAGTFDNTGRTLALTDATGSWLLGAPNGSPPLGTLIGGRITTSGIATLIGAAGTLDGVTLNGSLLVRNGTVTISHDLTLDQASITMGGSFPTLKFDGNGPQALTGTGTITMPNGSTVIVPDVPAGVSISGSGGLQGSAGTLFNQGTISTSSPGFPLGITTLMNEGRLDVSNGGMLIVQQIANFSNGTLSGGTFASHGDRSTLILTGAGVATNSANLVLDGIGSGIYTDSHGTNALAHLVSTTAGGSFTVSGGRSFAPTGGAYSNAGLLEVGPASTFTAPVQLTNTGTVAGAGSVEAHLNNAGLVTPGASAPGILTASGIFNQSTGGTLNLRIGGQTAGTQYDQLNVNGGLALGGTLNVALLNGFTPAVGDTFQILRFQAESGGFDTLNLPALPTGSAWDASRLYSDGVLAVAATPATGTPNPNPLPTAFPRPPSATTGIAYGADSTAGGFDDYWANPAQDGDFGYFNNWADQIAPSAADTAVFNGGSTGHTVHFAADTQTHGLAVGNDHVTLDLGGHQYTVDNGTASPDSIAVGLSAANASLGITHGTLVPKNDMSVGFAVGSNGVVLVNGLDAHLNAPSLFVGDLGQGEVDVAAGASVVTSQETSVGRQDHSAGTIRVIGPGSSWTSNGNAGVTIGFGNNSQGALYITNGGSFQAIGGLLAAEGPGSTALVVVSGVSGNRRATLTFPGGAIGSYGSGTLTVADGALVSDDNVLDIGSSFGSNGTVTVGGASGGFNAELNAGQINIANNETSSTYAGSLTVNSGGKVSAPRGVTLGNGGAAGTLMIAGGQADVGRLQVTSGAASLSAGILTVSGGEALATGVIVPASFNQSGGSHTISGPSAGGDTLRIGDTNYTGPFAFTLSGGSLTVNGNTANYGSFVQTGGNATLQTVTGTGSLSVGGGSGPATLVATWIGQSALSVGDNGTVTLRTGLFPVTSNVTSLNISGSGRLNLANNNLVVQYASGHSPAAMIDQLLASGYNGGAWDGPGIDSSSAHGAFALGFADSADATATGVPANSVLVKLTLVGDANLDGRVDFTDLVSLAQHYGQTVSAWDAGDFNYDGKVGFDDLLLLAQDYGHSLGAAATAELNSAFAGEAGKSFSQVPDPALVPLMAGGMLIRRRRASRASSGCEVSA